MVLPYAVDVLATTPAKADMGCVKQSLISQTGLWQLLETLSRNTTLQSLFLFYAAFWRQHCTSTSHV